jgi:type II secretory pathway component PulK
MARSRSGFVLLAVLSVMVGVTALGLALSLAARNAIRSSENRRSATIAAWRAEGCAERARGVIRDVLGGGNDGRSSATGVPSIYSRGDWRTLDRWVAESPLMRADRCAVELEAAGSTIDVNAASEELLHGLFAALHLPEARIDSLTDALLDWRDADDVPRPSGAEREWYEREHRVTPLLAPRNVPRNAPLEDPRELADVRGFDALPGIDSLLGVEPGRIDLGHAPLPVIAALPGFGSEAVARVAEDRLRGVARAAASGAASGVAPADLLSLAARLSPNARSAIVARYADLARLTTVEPDAWILTSRARAGEPAITAVVELRLVRAGTRAAIVRRRSRVE